MKKQKLQFAVVLVLLFVLIGGYLGLKQYNKVQTEQEAAKVESSKSYIAQVNTSEITKFSYQLNGQTLTYTYTNGNWICDADTTQILDASKVTTLLSNLSSFSASQIVKEPEALSEYGFDQPTNIITFSTDKGTTTLTVGMSNPISGEYYIKSDQSEELYTCESTTVSAFFATLESLVVDAAETEEMTEAQE